MWELPLSNERFFEHDERQAVTAIFESILPGDATSPGATDINAVEYVDRLLALDEAFYYEIKTWKNLYRNGLPALQAASAALYAGRAVAQLSPDELTSLLGALAGGALANAPANLDQKTFFAVLRNHCVEGAFADPRWGGNRDSLMWRWYGYLQNPQGFRRDDAGRLQEV